MVHTSSVRRQVSGFTLVELLVVTLILSILMAVALPLYLSAVKDSRIKTNRANMQTVANAVQAAYVKDRPADYSKYYGAVSTANEPDLQTPPIGPSGETYVIAAGSVAGSFKVSCTPDPDAAGTFEPGKDNK